jgi:RNA polymerase sigma-70 factor, ECF subfamily
VPPSENALPLEMLYDTYGSSVYRLALRMLGNASDAADLTQAVFIDFWRLQHDDAPRDDSSRDDAPHNDAPHNDAPHNDAPSGSLLAFLLMMTRSRSLDQRQQKPATNLRQKRRSTVKLSPTVTSLNQADRGFEPATLPPWTEQLQPVFAALPQAQSQVLEMVYYEDLSQAEIADRLAVPVGIVQNRSRQGLLKLCQHLQPTTEEPNLRFSEH